MNALSACLLIKFDYNKRRACVSSKGTSESPWIPERRLPYMIVKGEVHLYEDQQ